MRGAKEELYPIRKDIFHETYDVLTSEEDEYEELHCPHSGIVVTCPVCSTLLCADCGEIIKQKDLED